MCQSENCTPNVISILYREPNLLIKILFDHQNHSKYHTVIKYSLTKNTKGQSKSVVTS